MPTPLTGSSTGIADGQTAVTNGPADTDALSAASVNGALQYILHRVKFLLDFVSKTHTWTALQTFSAKIYVPAPTGSGHGTESYGGTTAGAGGRFFGGGSAGALVGTAAANTGVGAAGYGKGDGPGLYARPGDGAAGLGIYATDSGTAGQIAAKFEASGTNLAAHVVGFNGGAMKVESNQGTTLICEPNSGSHAPIQLVPRGAAPPASGAHEVGELCVTFGGKLYICSVAGTPGTWTIVGTQT